MKAGNPAARKWLLVALLVMFLLGLLVLLFRLFMPGDGFHTLPSSKTFGLVLIDIGDTEDQVSFHVPEKGVYVLVVEENSPAAASGILSGDRIVTVNGSVIMNASDFYERCAALKSNEKVKITVARGNQQETVELISETSS